MADTRNHRSVTSQPDPPLTVINTGDLIAGQTYTAAGRDIVYRARYYSWGWFLRELNESYSWRDSWGCRQGHISGYVLRAGKLYAWAYDIRDGRSVEQKGAQYGRYFEAAGNSAQ